MMKSSITLLIRDYHCTKSYPYTINQSKISEGEECLEGVPTYRESNLKMSFFVRDTRVNYTSVVVKKPSF